MANNFISLDSVLICAIVPIMPNVLNLPKWIKIDNTFYPKTNCTNITISNSNYTIGSTLGSAKLTKYIRDITYVPSYHLSIFVGLLLSDGGLSKQKKSTNARFALKQSMIHFPFIWSTFMLLSHYCSSVPYIDY